MKPTPRDPLMWTFLASKAIALFMLERYDEALETSRRAQQYPISAIWAYMGELATIGVLENKQAAEVALQHALKKQPDLTISFVEKALPITHQSSRGRFLGGLAKAGVPDPR